MGVPGSIVELDFAILELTSWLAAPSGGDAPDWPEDGCVLSRCVHKIVWKSRPAKQRVAGEIIPLLEKVGTAIIARAIITRDQDLREDLIKYARNVGLRASNLRENYLKDLPSDFAPDAKLTEEENKVRAAVTLAPESANRRDQSEIVERSSGQASQGE